MTFASRNEKVLNKINLEDLKKYAVDKE